MIILRLIFITSLLFPKFGQPYDINSPRDQVKQLRSDGEIVFIFKKQNTNKSSQKDADLLGSGIYYSENNDFIVVELYPNNSVITDTIIKNVVGTKICLSHRYDKTKRFLYEFQSGDTIIFDYDKGYPYATINNRKTLTFDNNFLTDIKINEPIGDFDFIIKNKRIRNENESIIYFKELEKYKIAIQNSLDSLLNQNQLSPSIYEIQKASIKFFEMNTNRLLLKEATSKDLKRDDLLYLKTYRHFLNNYIIERFKLKTKFSSDPMSCDSRIAFDSITKSSVFSKKIKESLLFIHLVNIADHNSTLDLHTYFNKFKKIVDAPLLNERINNLYFSELAISKEEVDEVYFSNIFKDKITLQSLILKNRGKVIIIDFWASWCAPCRATMPSSRKLKEEYEGKDLVFIYASIDTDFEKWSNASQKEMLPQSENNLLALNYPQALFYQNLQLKTIPRYIIYNKVGVLIDKNAPNLDTKEIREVLNTYLKE